ncbi:MAG: DUF3108 domain-containing protein [Candidatus Tectomicrobia bacterium]|uniref:DUF3108 domain-containing protein n=1 Tax=Tectimicrobiota bacterium TaxID=2528274 RepID=A0A932I121_UNCTE|nr:DUF3108 domain-containing protein [Candidatus Tectomicrobia bacterium]
MHPFRSGERLAYQVRWLGIPVLTTELAVEGPVEWQGERVLRYRLRLDSIGLLHRLYPVRDRAVSLADSETLASRRADIRQKEGFRYRSHKWLLFGKDHVLYGREEKTPVRHDAPEGVLDALAALYKIRAEALRPGSEIELSVFDRKRTRRVKVRVTQADRLDSLWGPIRTLRIEPEFEDESLNRKGRAWIWVTADEARVPVRIESKTFVGSFVAHLIETHGLRGGPLASPPQKALSAWRPSTEVVPENEGDTSERLKQFLNRKQK